MLELSRLMKKTVKVWNYLVLIFNGLFNLLERKYGKKAGRLLMLWPLPKSLNNLDYLKPSLGARNSSQVSNWVAEIPALEPSPSAYPGTYLKKAGIRNRSRI